MKELRAKGTSFPHFSDLRNHKKMRVLRNCFGSVIGYSFCNVLMELICSSTHQNWESPHVLDLCRELEIEEATVRALIDKSKALELFITTSDGIYYNDWNQSGEPRILRLVKFSSYGIRLSIASPATWQKLRRKVFVRDNFTCVYCKSTNVHLEGDHVVPFSKGGDDSMENLVTACRKCNREKRDKSLTEFLEWKEARND